MTLPSFWSSPQLLFLAFVSSLTAPPSCFLAENIWYSSYGFMNTFTTKSSLNCGSFKPSFNFASCTCTCMSKRKSVGEKESQAGRLIEEQEEKYFGRRHRYHTSRISSTTFSNRGSFTIFTPLPPLPPAAFRLGRSISHRGEIGGKKGGRGGMRGQQ